MKLLLCRKCQDVFKLQSKQKTCACGAVGGRYFEDGINAEYWGENAVPIGFANSTLADAILDQPEEGWGKEFKAFVIPKVCPTMQKVNKQDGAHRTRSGRLVKGPAKAGRTKPVGCPPS